MSHDFSERPFIAGSLTGVRSFKIDKLGRLTGVSYTRTFTPGVNVATCPTYGAVGYGMADDLWMYLPPRLRRPSARAGTVSLTKQPKHRVGNLNCGCGFYAYFDRKQNAFHQAGQVQGIIEGFGSTVTVGSRGFRSEKARLVALVRPAVLGRPGDALADRLYNHDWLLPVGSGVAILSLIGLVQAAAVGPLWAIAPSILALLAGVVLVYLMFRSIDVHYDDLQPKRGGFAAVRRNYPDVPVYRSLKAALRDHPLTPPPPPVQPTPENDPDFWTRRTTRTSGPGR